jgi:hypothetical protein
LKNQNLDVLDNAQFEISLKILHLQCRYKSEFQQRLEEKKELEVSGVKQNLNL